jgi:hypothetical protein
MPVSKPRPFTFKIAPADFAELEQLAKVNERTVSAELRLLIRQHLIQSRTATA